MIITIIAEPRSGSTNLANWFFTDKDFTILFEPITNPNTKWFKKGVSPSEWIYETKHLLVKECYDNYNDFKKLIEISDKVIFLYRENEKEQIESYYNAKKTKNWHTTWAYKKNLEINEDDISYFKSLKNNFKKLFLDQGKYFHTTYEKLYYQDGILSVMDYIGNNKLIKERFPFGDKYRIDVTDREKFI